MREKKLIEDDQAAVDLLLDRQTDGFYMQSLADSGVFVKSVDVNHQRVRSVKHILNLLKEMPVADPPADLAGKTLRRVYASGAGEPSIVRPSTPDPDSDQQRLS